MIKAKSCRKDFKSGESKVCLYFLLVVHYEYRTTNIHQNSYLCNRNNKNSFCPDKKALSGFNQYIQVNKETDVYKFNIMLKRVVLKPIVGGGKKIWFQGTILYANGDEIIITQDFRIKTRREMMPGEKPLDVKFGVSLTSFIIEWDSQYENGSMTDAGGKLVGEMDYRKYNAYKELCKHQKTKPPVGMFNPNLKGQPLFELEDLAIRNQYGSSRIVNQQKVVTKVLGMSFQELTDCAFYYGYSGSSKNRSDLFIFLADFKLGVLHDDIVRNQNQLSTMDDFLTKYKTGGQAIEVKVVVEKALLQGVFTKLENGYFYNNQYIGTKKEHIIDYLNGREEIYDFVKSQVVNAQLGEDDIKQIIESAGTIEKKSMPDEELLKTESDGDEKMTREMAKRLHIKAWAQTKPETLISMFPEASELIKQCRLRAINIDMPIMYTEQMKKAISDYDKKLNVQAPPKNAEFVTPGI